MQSTNSNGTVLNTYSEIISSLEDKKSKKLRSSIDYRTFHDNRDWRVTYYPPSRKNAPSIKLTWTKPYETELGVGSMAISQSIPVGAPDDVRRILKAFSKKFIDDGKYSTCLMNSGLGTAQAELKWTCM